MQQYDVYAMGHAVVDYNFDISFNTLNQLQVAPGLMNLISPGQTKQLISRLTNYPCFKELGGSAANTMTALAQLGGKGFHSCKVANDINGKIYASKLKKIGLTTNLDQKPLELGTTGECIILATDDGHHTMAGHLGISKQYSTQEVIEESLIHSKYLFIEGYLMHPHTSQQAVAKAMATARKNKVKIALSFTDLSVVKSHKQALRDLLKYKIDLLFCNRDEALEFCGHSVNEIINSSLHNFAKKFVITLGKDGVLLFDGKNYSHLPALKINNVVNTVGAGDTFAGAFLYGLTHNYSFTDCGKIASIAASKVVSKHAPRINKEEADSIMQSWLFSHSPA